MHHLAHLRRGRGAARAESGLPPLQPGGRGADGSGEGGGAAPRHTASSPRDFSPEARRAPPQRQTQTLRYDPGGARPGPAARRCGTP